MRIEKIENVRRELSNILGAKQPLQTVDDSSELSAFNRLIDSFMIMSKQI